MYLTSIIGNSQKLDGGAMFGNVPKAMWSKWITPDDANRISLACRALLIQDANKIILLEVGIGAFFNPTLRERYGVEQSNHVLLDSLQSEGIEENDIDMIILSHLHFDHAGGLLSQWQEGEPQKLLFPNAKYIVNKLAWERACNPHPRDKASFIPSLNKLLQGSGRLEILEKNESKSLGKNYKFLQSNGHTPGLLHTVIKMGSDEGVIIFASDLIPGTPWVHLPVTMGYDRAPELVIDEKKEMLEFAIKQNGRIFYTHDPNIAMTKVSQEENGKFVVTDVLQDFKKLEI